MLPPAPHRAPSRPSLGVHDGVVAAALAIGFALLYAALEQRWLWTDGWLLGSRLEWDELRLWPHPAYLPVVRWLDLLGGEPGPYDGLLAASWLPGGIAIGAAWLTARAFGASGPAALFGALALAFTPVAAFFATTVEVHALHAAAVGVGAFVALRAPWHRPGVAIACTALAFLPVALTHLFAVFLGLGWLALAAHGARLAGAPLARRHLFFALAPALVACGLVTFALNAWGYWQDSAAGAVAGTLAQVERDRMPFALAWWRDDVLVPLHLMWAAVALGVAVLVWRARRDDLARSAVRAHLALAAPLFAFTAWFGVPNEGGYLLALAPFLAALAALGADAIARAVPRGVAVVAAVALLAVVGRAGWQTATAWRQDHAQQQRSARAEQARRVLGERGVLVSFDPVGQPIGLDVPGLRERHVLHHALDALRDGTSPEHTAAALTAEIVALVASHPEGVALDLTYRRMGAAEALLAPYAAALEAELARHVILDEREHPFWPMARLAPRSP